MVSRTRSRSRALAWSLVGSLAFAGGANALTLSESSVVFDIGGSGATAGVIDFLGTTTGVPLGGSVLEGSIGIDQDVFVFQLTLDPSANALDSIRVGATVGTSGETRIPTGGGTVPGSRVPIIDVVRIGDFESLLFGVGLGARSDLFFIAFADLAAGDRIQFGFPGQAGRVDFVGVTVVPEPATSGLLIGGLAVFGALRGGGAAAHLGRRRRA